MKFEKFFKSAGVYGEIVKTVNHSWLICGGVGMRIPDGVNNFGTVKESNAIFDTIMSCDISDDVMTLDRAIMLKPDGKPSDIIRVFATNFGDEIGIRNEYYGLIEKSDRLVYLEIEDENDAILKYLVITDIKGEEILGFINGLDEI